MIELTLEVTEVIDAEDGTADLAESARRFCFTESGGTIGRGSARGSHWLLPDKKVSSLHAVISYAGGSFQIEDRKSSNGVQLNGVCLAPGHAHPLRDGDVLLIKPYTIRATVIAAPRAAFIPSGESALTSGQILKQFAENWPSVPPSGEPPRGEPPPTPVGYAYVETPAPEPVRRADPGPSIPPGYNPDDDDSIFPSGKTGRERIVPPVAPPAPINGGESVMPRPSKNREAEVPPARVTPPAPGPAPRRDEALADLLAAAGIPDVPITPELANELGTILKIVAQGLVDVLKTRQEVKEEFDVGQTLPRLERNNPFKLARNGTGTQALQALFARRHAAFLDPIDAFRDSFDDLRQHHVAMSAGIRAAFDAMLAEFNPDRLEQRFSRRSSGAILPLPIKVRHWDAYRERFDDLLQGDPDEVFRRLFGDAFSQAYTSLLKSLKARRGEHDA